MEIPALGCKYDDGYFDKDEQGWVSAWVEVVQSPDGAVKINHWGDRNGLDPYQRTITTRVAAVFPELQLVKFEASQWYFDLAKQRLVSGDSWVILARRPATGDWLSPARVTSAIELCGRLLSTLGGPPLTLPAFPGWPPRTTESTYDFTRLQLPIAPGFDLELRYRPAISKTSSPELSVSLGAHAGVVITERGDCVISVRGGLEFHPAAKSVAQAWLAD